jgi:hypothetical protein
MNATLTRPAEAPAPDHIARVDALLSAWAPRTDEEWRRAWVEYAKAMARSFNIYRQVIPLDESVDFFRRTARTWEEINACDGIRLGELYRHRPDPARVWVQRAQEGDGSLWSASKREAV